MKTLKVLALVLLATFSYSAVNAQNHHHKVVHHKRHHRVIRHHHHA